MNYSRRNKQQTGRPVPSKKRKITTMDPRLLSQQAPVIEPEVFRPDLSFAEMDLHPKLRSNLAQKGYQYPTEIQQKAIPGLLDGRNMLGTAATGTGKTAAFLIPFIEQLQTDRSLKALILVPTRELAQQVEQEFRSLTGGMQLNVACFIGGTSVSRDISKCRQSHHLTVGTPGRLKDLIERGLLHLGDISHLILDEFDRMLDMGFIRDVKMITALANARRQTLLFSATADATQQQFINQILKDPLEIKVNSTSNASHSVEQNMVTVAENETKINKLLDLLKGADFQKVILFAETKRTVDKIHRELRQKGVHSDAIHGNKSQNYRSKAIQLFKTGQTRVLVATDVASRGIDIPDVTHVINYQLPQTMDAYIHRIGRTGRAGKKGVAYTFLN